MLVPAGFRGAWRFSSHTKHQFTENRKLLYIARHLKLGMAILPEDILPPLFFPYVLCSLPCSKGGVRESERER